jgi:hypothetical protein
MDLVLMNLEIVVEHVALTSDHEETTKPRYAFMKRKILIDELQVPSKKTSLISLSTMPISNVDKFSHNFKIIPSFCVFQFYRFW